jgi:hypothetical protein
LLLRSILTLFDPVCNELLKLMESNHWLRWKASPAFHQLIIDLKQSGQQTTAGSTPSNGTNTPLNGHSILVHSASHKRLWAELHQSTPVLTATSAPSPPLLLGLSARSHSTRQLNVYNNNHHPMMISTTHDNNTTTPRILTWSTPVSPLPSSNAPSPLPSLLRSHSIPSVTMASARSQPPASPPIIISSYSPNGSNGCSSPVTPHLSYMTSHSLHPSIIALHSPNRNGAATPPKSPSIMASSSSTPRVISMPGQIV